MHKKMFFAVVFAVVSLALGTSAFAEAVYLKNGKVMTGRIVERNDQFIVLKSSEDASAVKTTIYLEDINRIQSEAEYSNETKLIPTQILQSSTPKPWEAEPVALPSGNEPSGSVMVMPQQEIAPSSTEKTGFFQKLFGQGKEAATSSGLSTTPGGPKVDYSARGSASISGQVQMPNDFNSYKGDLIVYLMRDVGNGQFFMPPNMMYQKIDKSAISSFVYYKIDRVPGGTYKVFAEWDIAPPFMEKKKVHGFETLVGFGSKGDYVGILKDSITVNRGEQKNKVNLECTTYLNEGAPQAQPPVAVGGMGEAESLAEQANYQVMDIYYKKLVPQGGALLLVIKNLGDKRIDTMKLDVYIDDEKAAPNALSIGPIAPGEEKEFDIMSTFDKFKKQKEGTGENVSGKMLRFKIVSPASGEAELEKAIFILEQ